MELIFLAQYVMVHRHNDKYLDLNVREHFVEYVEFVEINREDLLDSFDHYLIYPDELF